MNKAQLNAASRNLNKLSKSEALLKESCSEEVYEKVIKSRNRLVISTIVMIILVLILNVVCMIWSSNLQDEYLNGYARENNINYAKKEHGHISLYGEEFYYTDDSKKYVVDLSKYGYDINDYEPRTEFQVYLDENNNVLDVSLYDESISQKSSDVLFWGIFGPLIIGVCFTVFVVCSKSNLNPGKEWYNFLRWEKSGCPTGQYKG